MTPESRKLYERGNKVLPTGVGSSGKFMKPYPLYIKNAKGSKILDVDGNEYIDLMCGAGPVILGHNHPVLVKAVNQCLEGNMSQTLLPYSLEVEFAEKINQILPHMERIRYLPTGTEAIHSAIRAARAFTGKDKFAKFEGGYHGQTDQVLVSLLGSKGDLDLAGSIENPIPVPSSGGIPKSLMDLVVPLSFGDIENTVELIEKNADDIACLVTDTVPMFGSGGFPPDKEFIQPLRKVTAENDILLIFDEIVTGFRLAGLGGAAKYFDVAPDLAVYGKICGGAVPLAMFGGRADVMQSAFQIGRLGYHVIDDKSKRIFQSGTFSGFPWALAAGLAVIQELERGDVYTRINRLGGLLRKGLAEAASDIGVSMQVNGIDSMFGVQFADRPLRNKREVITLADANKRYQFCLGLITKGVLAPTSHSLFLCGAHDDAQMETIIDAAKSVLLEMKKYEKKE